MLCSIISSRGPTNPVSPTRYKELPNEMTESVKDNGCTQTSHQDKTRLCGSQCKHADDSTYVVTNDRRQPNQTSLRRTLDEIGLHLNYNWLFINMSKSQLTEIIIGQKRGKITGHPPTLEVQKEPGLMKTFVSTRKFPNRSDWDQTDVAG